MAHLLCFACFFIDSFEWQVETLDEEWPKEDGATIVYEPSSNWHNKYEGASHINWYRPDAFQELVAALFRKSAAEDTLPYGEVARFFGVDDELKTLWDAPAIGANVRILQP